ncbi:leucine-rich repeat domain-containing protein, partial [Leptospira interrogans]
MKPNLIRQRCFQKVEILFLIIVCSLTQFHAEENHTTKEGLYTNLTEALKNPNEVRILDLSHNQLT